MVESAKQTWFGVLLIFSRNQSFFSLLAETESSVQNSGCDLAELKLELGEIHGLIRPTETIIAIFLVRPGSYLDPFRYYIRTGMCVQK